MEDYQLKTFEQNLSKLKKDELIKLIKRLAARIYKSDIVDCGMRAHTVGEGNEYKTVSEWKVMNILN